MLLNNVYDYFWKKQNKLVVGWTSNFFPYVICCTYFTQSRVFWNKNYDLCVWKFSHSGVAVSQFSFCLSIMKGWSTAIHLQWKLQGKISLSLEHSGMSEFWTEKGAFHLHRWVREGMPVIRVRSSAESSQRKADEQAHLPLTTDIFSLPFHGVIKGYSEPLKMPSILIENEKEHHFLKSLQKQAA